MVFAVQLRRNLQFKDERRSPNATTRRRSMRQRTFVDVIMIGIVDIIRMIIESDHIHLSSLLFFINLSLSSYFINLCLLSSSRGQFISSKFLLQVAFSKALPKCTQQLRFPPVFVQPEYDFQFSCTQNLDVLVGGSGHKIRLFVDFLELLLAIMEMHSFDGELGKGA